MDKTSVCSTAADICPVASDGTTSAADTNAPSTATQSDVASEAGTSVQVNRHQQALQQANLLRPISLFHHNRERRGLEVFSFAALPQISIVVIERVGIDGARRAYPKAPVWSIAEVVVKMEVMPGESQETLYPEHPLNKMFRSCLE